jgi:Phage derived protein Gp49-like (DUF891)
LKIQRSGTIHGNFSYSVDNFSFSCFSTLFYPLSAFEAFVSGSQVTDTSRAVYAVKIGEKIYVLHAFQKKSKQGIKTPQSDVDLIKQRYKDALAREQENNDRDNL